MRYIWYRMTNAESDRLVEENRCWACTVSNGAVAVLVGGIPLLGGIVQGDPALVVATAVWALVVFGYTLYRLLSRGYLPGAERIAKWTGLHERIGSGSRDGEADVRSGTEDHAK